MLKSGNPILHHLAITDQTVTVARMSRDASGALVDLRVFDLGDPGHDAEIFAFVGAPKGKFVRAYCSVLPASRFVRRVTLENPAKARDSGYLTELLGNTCKINPNENEVAVLRPDGAHPDAAKPFGKDILFVGARTEDLAALQSKILSWGVYPERLEIGTLPLLASVRRVAKAEGRTRPTLVLELGEFQSYIYIVGESEVDMTRNLSFGIGGLLPQIKSELGLADEATARKILLANTFDFTEMAPGLLRRLVKEIQASIGFYEVQTGLTIGQMFPANLSARFQWVGSHISRATGLDVMAVSFERWPEIIGVTTGPDLDLSNADPLSWNLFALAGRYE